LTEKATFSYSTDGITFQPLGGEFTMIFQVRTFQGVRYALFNYNVAGAPGGYADFSRFTVDEPRPSGFTRPIPFDRTIVLRNLCDGSVLIVKNGSLAAVPAADPLAGTTAAQYKVGDLGLGRVSLSSAGASDDSQAFQWTEMPRGDLLLLSLASHRHLCIKPNNGTVAADETGAQSDRKNGASFTWQEIATNSNR
jgi:hypothetical protein